MKKRALIWIISILVVILLVSGYFVFFAEEPLLSPADVSIRVGNAPPRITVTPSAVIPVTLTAATTTNVIVTFTARDPNGAADLNDAAARVTFSMTGESSRTGGCVVQSSDSKTKTYACTIQMQYYDRAGLWDAEFYIEDLATTPNSDTLLVNTIVDVGQLKAIAFTSSIDLGIITPGDTGVLLPNVLITNEGNYATPANGFLLVTANALTGVTTPSESIQATEFYAGDPSQACAGVQLSGGLGLSIPDVTLPRGPAGTNTGNLAFCIALVPEVSAQEYAATGVNQWIIEL